MTTINRESRVVPSEGQISATVEGEAVILDTSSGVYFGLDRVGTRIWDFVQEKPRTAGELCDLVLSEFDVEPDRCERNVLALLEDLAAHDLIEVCDEPGS